jgi:phospholipase D1/2
LSPELYLRRPPAKNAEWRLDRILKRKAEQGVKICVAVYQEVRIYYRLCDNLSALRHPKVDPLMTINSAHTEVRGPVTTDHKHTPNRSDFQRALEALHPNIACMRHPHHILGTKGKHLFFSLGGVFIY